jgi:hypothetical protein
MLLRSSQHAWQEEEQGSVGEKASKIVSIVSIAATAKPFKGSSRASIRFLEAKYGKEFKNISPRLCWMRDVGSETIQTKGRIVFSISIVLSKRRT